jgi:hypothetical protein
MKICTQERSGIMKVLFMITLLLIACSFLIGCGEVVAVGDIDPGGGGPNNLMLSWNAPRTNEDGSDLQDLAGYKLYYGTRPGQYSQVINVGDYTTTRISDLASGTYYLAVTAYDIYGNESVYSTEINHTFL